MANAANAANAGAPAGVEAWCVRCRAKKMMKDPKQVTMPAKGGGTRPAMKGSCPDCSTGMFRILPKK